MKLSDKIVGLRKSNGMSQEDLAEKLDVSRQAISRWESGAAMPDANNILQLSKLFDVTTDYLLNDDYRITNRFGICQETNRRNDSSNYCYDNNPERRLFIIQHTLHPFFYPNLAKGKRANQNRSSIYATRE